MREERGEKGRERNMKCVSSTHRDGTADKCTTFVCLLHFLQKKKQNKPITLCSCSVLAAFAHSSLAIQDSHWLHKFSQKKPAARIFTEETGCTNFHRRNWLDKFAQKKLLDKCRTASDEHIKALERGWFHIISTQVTSVHWIGILFLWGRVKQLHIRSCLKREFQGLCINGS